MLTIDPATIADPTLRDVITSLMNHIEALEERVRRQVEEMQRLRDENNRLRGEQGQPIVRPSTPQQDLSSDRERAEWLPRPQHRRARAIRSTDEQRLVIEPASLPSDAIFKGYQPGIVQELVVQAQGIRFLREKCPVADAPTWLPCRQGSMGTLGRGLRRSH